MKDRTISTSRVINAPPDVVFRAWTDPAQLAKWWGPEGFTNTFHEFDLRPGGIWRFVMHGPDGVDYPNESRFKEIIPPQSIVIQHLSIPRFELTGTFEDVGGKTRLTFSQMFDSPEVCKKIRAVSEPYNEQNLDRLETLLKTLK